MPDNPPADTSPEPHQVRVGVVIPCYNHGAFVADAVNAALGQIECEGVTLDIHVVVIDDGSTDDQTPSACDACAGERVVVIHQQNMGLPAARNRGVREICDVDYFVFLDADDWIEPTFCAKLVRALLDSDDAASHAYCQERLVGLGTGIWEVPEWDADLLMITNLHPVTCVVKRACFGTVGGFNEAMTNGYEDWDFWLKIAESGWHGVRVREPLFVWRRHSHDTMVMNVIAHHESLYRTIIDNHRAFYESQMEDVAVRTNVLLRKFNMNWIDETGYPKELRYLQSVRDRYNASGVVAARDRAEMFLQRSPRVIADPIRACLRTMKRVILKSQ
ncbi:MAG: glycosyltransferase family 2 protein [Phycisphaeraceae bacterium]|nr:glycosyltransferase family 2 protein [Phycisphaerales bacterium]MCB9860123.1 glycosyltransferase family 2 protein [Phycisphaeraceae bacterium]